MAAATAEVTQAPARSAPAVEGRRLDRQNSKGSAQNTADAKCVANPTNVCPASAPRYRAASFPCSQWLVALTGCTAPLPSARASTARAAAETRLATVPLTSAPTMSRAGSLFVRRSIGLVLIGRVLPRLQDTRSGPCDLCAEPR